MSEYECLPQQQMTAIMWYESSWKYFSLLSGQRMQMFQYYITLEVFLCGAFITLISLDVRLQWAELVVSGLIALMSITFRLLDHRTKTMIHCCEDAMIAIEKADNGNKEFHPIMSVNSCKKASLTYTKLICSIQILLFLLVLIGLFLCL